MFFACMYICLSVLGELLIPLILDLALDVFGELLVPLVLDLALDVFYCDQSKTVITLCMLFNQSYFRVSLFVRLITFLFN